MNIVTFKNFFFNRERKNNSVLLEIKNSEINKLKDDIKNLNKRPFQELFGNKDRFAVKYTNLKFLSACETLGLDPDKFDLKKGFYGKNERYGKAIKDSVNKKISENTTGDNIKINKAAEIAKGILQQRNVFSYMIFSRHPIDVLRMSDISKIKSCHSPSGIKYDCALVESKNNGGIVYVVSESDFKKIKDKLNNPEIFKDVDRGIGGIDVIARVRLRRFFDIKEADDFAVPEQRYYIPEGNIMGYSGKWVDMVLEYCQKNQNIFRENLSNEYIEENIIHVGGSYTDTKYYALLSFFFNKNIKSVKSVEQKPYVLSYDEFEDILNFENIEDWFNEQIKKGSLEKILLFYKKLQNEKDHLQYFDEKNKLEKIYNLIIKNINKLKDVLPILFELKYNENSDSDRKMFYFLTKSYLTTDFSNEKFFIFTDFLIRNTNLLNRIYEHLGFDNRNIRDNFFNKVTENNWSNFTIMLEPLKQIFSKYFIKYLIDKNDVDYALTNYADYIFDNNAFSYFINKNNILKYIHMFSYEIEKNPMLRSFTERIMNELHPIDFLYSLQTIKIHKIDNYIDPNIACYKLHEYIKNLARYYKTIYRYDWSDDMSLREILNIIKNNKDTFASCRQDIYEIYDNELSDNIRSIDFRYYIKDLNHLEKIIKVAEDYNLINSLNLLQDYKKNFSD